MSSSVFICGLDHAIRNLPDLSSDVGFKLEKIRLALVKPNICGLYHPSGALLSSIIQFLLSNAELVVVGETSSMMHEPMEQFERLGVNALLRHFSERGRTIDLSKDKRVDISIPNPHALKRVDLPETVLDSDVLVNVPRVGTHSTTILTCALKNLFGLLPEKHKYSQYHSLGIDNVIADIAQVVKTDLNVVDVGSRVVLGTDPLSVDIVACRFLDVDPLTVTHLNLVSEDRGERLEDFMKKMKVTEV
jgi:uncharacterized protein (DUF362 family)